MTLTVVAVAALWILGGIAIYMLLSFGAMDDDKWGRVMIAAFWPVAVIFLAGLFLIEALKGARS